MSHPDRTPLEALSEEVLADGPPYATGIEHRHLSPWDDCLRLHWLQGEVILLAETGDLAQTDKKQALPWGKWEVWGWIEGKLFLHWHRLGNFHPWRLCSWLCLVNLICWRFAQEVGLETSRGPVELKFFCKVSACPCSFTKQTWPLYCISAVCLHCQNGLLPLALLL